MSTGIFISLAAGLLVFIGWELTIRVGKYVCIVMECDDFIDQLLEVEKQAQPPESKAAPIAAPSSLKDGEIAEKRQRLAALAMGGQSQQYLGKTMSADQIEDLSPDGVEKLYARYEARLGASMTKTIGSAAIQLYCIAAGGVLPIPKDRQALLVADLEADPFVSHALNTATCELYHRYGMWLAPITAMLSTVKHCRPASKQMSSIVEHCRADNENGDYGGADGADTSGGCRLANARESD
jgi:hypothetical protein